MIQLTLMFRVAHVHKAKKELRRTEKLLNEKLDVSKCERYWKSPKLWTATPPLSSTQPRYLSGSLASRYGPIGWQTDGTCLGHSYGLMVALRISQASSGARNRQLEFRA